MLEKTTHWCAPCDKLDPAPWFYVIEAIDQRNDQHFPTTMLGITTMYGMTAVQVMYCPWCGVRVTEYDAFGELKVQVGERHEYYDYRKRLIQSGVAKTPMTKDEWERTLIEFNETDFLIAHAKPENVEGLAGRMRALSERLILS